MRVYFSPRATRDLTSIFLYLDARSKNGARNVMRAIRDSIRLISENPRAWQATDIEGVNVKSVRRYPFKIFYRVRNRNRACAAQRSAAVAGRAIGRLQNCGLACTTPPPKGMGSCPRNSRLAHQ